MPDTAEIVEEGPSRADAGRAEQLSRHELYALAKEKQIPGRSRMSRDELAEALGES